MGRYRQTLAAAAAVFTTTTLAFALPSPARASDAIASAFADFGAIPDSDAGDDAASGVPAANDPAYLQCVPYARKLSGIRIYGDARSWWDQAQGHYATGHVPKVGAVMAMPPHAGSRLGHVAAVSKVIDSRTILISHANWSPIDGRRGQIEDNVTALDVSPANDWSEVRIWYAPIGDLGTTRWPVSGFIYNAKPEPQIAASTTKKGRQSDPIGAIIAGNY